MVTWTPRQPDLVFQGDERLNGEDWPDVVLLRAWEWNEEGENRIKATRTYRLVAVEQERDQD